MFCDSYMVFSHPHQKVTPKINKSSDYLMPFLNIPFFFLPKYHPQPNHPTDSIIPP